MIELDYFLSLYLNMKRNILQNKFLQLPKSKRIFNERVHKLINLLNTLHADPIDFLNFMTKYYSPMRIVPTPGHMLNEKAVNKFRYYQNLKNRYIYDDFTIDSDNVLLHYTLENISYRKDFICSVDQDIRLKYIMFLLNKKEYTFKEEDKKNIVYVYCKLKFQGKPIPERIKELYENM